MSEATSSTTSSTPATEISAKPGNPLLDLPLDEVPAEWREHARELRRENARLRELAKASDEKAARGASLLQSERHAAGKRIVQVELRAAAQALGIKDLDALKLLDTTALTLDDASGEVDGIAELLAAFKKAKPYLFKEAAADAAQARKTPDRSSGRAFDARHATREEIAADARARGLNLRRH